MFQRAVAKNKVMHERGRHMKRRQDDQKIGQEPGCRNGQLRALPNPLELHPQKK